MLVGFIEYGCREIQGLYISYISSMEFKSDKHESGAMEYLKINQVYLKQILSHLVWLE